MSDDYFFDDFMDFKLSGSSDHSPMSGSGCSTFFWGGIIILLILLRIFT